MMTFPETVTACKRTAAITEATIPADGTILDLTPETAAVVAPAMAPAMAPCGKPAGAMRSHGAVHR